jgi:hypothetical protein
MLYRRGTRAEALVIGGVALSFLLYNAGYWLPFGGGSPGPRFLIPMLPFIAVPLGLAFRRFPAVTIALAIPSAVLTIVSTTTQPLIGFDWTGYWANVLDLAGFEHTVATILGAGNGWGGLLPFLLAIAGGIGLAIRASDRLSVARGALPAAIAVGLWACVALAAPDLLGVQYHGQYANAWSALIASTAAGAIAVVGAAAAFELRASSRAAQARGLRLSVPRQKQIDGEPVPAYSSQRQSS